DTGVERKDAISLDRTVDQVKDGPGRGRVASDHHPGNTVNRRQTTLQLVEAYRLHDAIVPDRSATGSARDPIRVSTGRARPSFSPWPGRSGAADGSRRRRRPACAAPCPACPEPP